MIEPLIPAHRNQRQANLSVKGQLARVTQRNPMLKIKRKEKRKRRKLNPDRLFDTAGCRASSMYFRSN